MVPPFAPSFAVLVDCDGLVSRRAKPAFAHGDGM